MNASNDWAKVAAFALSLALPAAAVAGGFESANDSATAITEYVITDDAAPPARPTEVIPVEYDSVLVPSDGAALPGRGPVLESVPGESASCEMCGAQGCVSCCGTGGCGGGDHGSGWFSAPGYFNRLLGDACPRWVAQVDALMLWQGNIASRPLLTDFTTGATVLDANQTQTLMSGGPRFGLFFNLDRCYAIEGNYFNVGTFPADAPLTPGGDYTNTNLPFVVSGAPYTLTSTGRIQSAELNWRRRQCSLPITWLAGFRWVEWNQAMQVTAVATEVFPAVATTSSAGNDLYGGQIGMDLGLWNAGGRFTVNGIGKAGVFLNNAYQRSAIIFEGETADAIAANAQQTSFFGELGVNSSLRLSESVAWRVGYSLFWLSGVVVPANQMSLAMFDAPAINTNGSVLLHGVTTGLEVRW